MRNNKKAVAYVRKTTSSQERQAQSLQSQLEKLTGYAKQCNLEIVQVFEHIGTGGEQLQNALTYCRANKDVEYLLVTSPNVLSHDYEKVAFWEKTFRYKGVKVRTLEMEKPTIVMLNNLIDSYTARSEQVKRGLRHKKEMTKAQS